MRIFDLGFHLGLTKGAEIAVPERRPELSGMTYGVPAPVGAAGMSTNSPITSMLSTNDNAFDLKALKPSKGPTSAGTSKALDTMTVVPGGRQR